MKSLKSGAIGVLLSLCAYGVRAQQSLPPGGPEGNKPKLFADLPAKMNLYIQDLEPLLDAGVNSAVNLQVAPGFHFRGVVVSKSDTTGTTSRTVVIKCLNRQGAALTFTRNLNADGSYTYRGRILSFKHGDAFELTTEGGKLVLVKTDTSELLNE